MDKTKQRASLLEDQPATHKKITPQQAQQILAENGLHVTTDQVEAILKFLTTLAAGTTTDNLVDKTMYEVIEKPSRR
jgi:hypothetical protein